MTRKIGIENGEFPIGNVYWMLTFDEEFAYTSSAQPSEGSVMAGTKAYYVERVTRVVDSGIVYASSRDDAKRRARESGIFDVELDQARYPKGLGQVKRDAYSDPDE